MFKEIAYIMEMIGTVAFASSGAILGIRKGMDVFGIIILGGVTALGGGVIRDLVLGATPPAMFTSPTAVILSVITTLILFCIFYAKIDFLDTKIFSTFEKLMNILDAIGLGVFTSIGISKAIYMGYENKILLLFVGMVTGVGGGIIRDTLSNISPVIFREQIYAIASLIGATFYIYFFHKVETYKLMIISAVIVTAVRLVSIKLNLRLNKIKI